MQVYLLRKGLLPQDERTEDQGRHCTSTVEAALKRKGNVHGCAACADPWPPSVCVCVWVPRFLFGLPRLVPVVQSWVHHVTPWRRRKFVAKAKDLSRLGLCISVLILYMFCCRLCQPHRAQAWSQPPPATAHKNSAGSNASSPSHSKKSLQKLNLKVNKPPTAWISWMS